MFSLCLVMFIMPGAPEIPEGGVNMLPDDDLSALRLNIQDESLGYRQVISVSGLPFDRAMRITTLKVPERPWFVQFGGRARGAIERGDVCLLSFWIRGVRSEDETRSAVANAFVQRNRPLWGFSFRPEPAR